MKNLAVILILCTSAAIVLSERTQYHVSGHQGPYSYKFGYDTGPHQGYDRQFRHEEKDGKGVVYGHYGYYTKYGKPIVVHYRAHPYYGFEILNKKTAYH